jgi:pimeloyl-ACP methyl ester carboxylesterase
MLVIVLAALSFTVPMSTPEAPELSPGDGVGLSPVAPAVSPLELPAPTHVPRTNSEPLGYGLLGGAALMGGAAISRRRRRSREPLYVLVHGNGGSAEDFDPLLDRLGIDPQNTVAFEYRTDGESGSSTDASRTEVTGRAARELDELIRELAETNANIYSIHHSKGGAVGVSMIASLDQGIRPPIDGYRGAALLDPAIGSGPLGRLQRAGRPLTFVPDNGGFDPIRCIDGECWDVRDHLGEASGVEVIAIRNPDAVLTNFTDMPEHLRVYDLIDDGGSSAVWYVGWLPSALNRMRAAHASVLDSWAVADCIKAEVARAKSCVWKGDSRGRRPMWGSGNSKNMVR